MFVIVSLLPQRKHFIFICHPTLANGSEILEFSAFWRLKFRFANKRVQGILRDLARSPYGFLKYETNVWLRPCIYQLYSHKCENVRTGETEKD